jgi:uncharacterized membrane protein YfcA
MTNAAVLSPVAPWAFPLLFATGIAAGFVDSIAGGGGMITLPVLLSVGVPPEFALGAGKLQATFGSGAAAWHYARSKIVSLGECGPGVFFTTLGAIAGTLLVQRISPDFLKHLIPVLLVALAAYLIFQPRLGAADIHPRCGPGPFYLVAGLSLGFYDGFLGPGTGSFWTMAYMLGLGFNLTKATGRTKVMNFASNVSSLAFFALGHHVYYAVGLVMGLGQLLGARIGSGMVIARGARFIRPIFLAMVLAVTLKLLYDTYRK